MLSYVQLPVKVEVYDHSYLQTIFWPSATFIESAVIYGAPFAGRRSSNREVFTHVPDDKSPSDAVVIILY